MRESEASSHGDALSMGPQDRRAALYRAEDVDLARPRQLPGDGEFVSFADARGERAGALASDPALLIAFVQESAREIRTRPSLTRSAEIFLGNAIARLKSEARWQPLGDRAPTVGNLRIQFEPAAAIARLLAGDP